VDWFYASGGRPFGPLTADGIQELFVNGRIDERTLVWRKGMLQWTPLGEVPEFEEFFSEEDPPPLPPDLSAPRPPSDETREDSARAPPVAPESRREPVFNFGSPVAHLAGPWTRYFARTIDLSIVATVLMTVAFVALPYVSTALYLQAYAADARVLFLISLPFAHLVIALIVTIFGNSLGKAIFGIRAVPVDGRERFSLGENVAREFRVWTQGLALGIPIANFFTMVPAFRRVAAGEPAPYDVRIASVQSFSTSTARRVFGMLLAIGLFAAITFSNAIDKIALENLAKPSTWQNPVTSSTTSIPANWEYEAIEGPDGGTLYSFTNLKTGAVVFFAVEYAPAMEFSAYTEALTAVLRDSIGLGRWAPEPSIPGTWKASGHAIPDRYPANIYVKQVGTNFWRVVYLDQLTRGDASLPGQMAAALFGTVGVQ
jgi:hypothetical protein